MSGFWKRLEGKKTYLLAATCIGTVLLKAVADQVQGASVDWPGVAREVMACLMAMALRHGLATAARPS